jgi:iron complex outermembrane receptor protein
VNFVPNQKLQFKPFITLQKTETEDLPSLYVDPSLGIPVTYSNSEHLHTPGSFGGFYFNYGATNKLNINLNGYYFGKHTNYDASFDAGNPDTDPEQYKQGQISGKFLLNVKVSYEVINGLNVFVGGRNLLGSSSREFYGSEQTKGLFLAGLSYKMN